MPDDTNAEPNAAEYAGLVLLFNTCAHHTRAARLHAADCAMVNTSRGTRGAVKRSEDPQEIAESVEDLNERGFPVKRCKCCAKKK